MLKGFGRISVFILHSGSSVYLELSFSIWVKKFESHAVFIYGFEGKIKGCKESWKIPQCIRNVFRIPVWSHTKEISFCYVCLHKPSCTVVLFQQVFWKWNAVFIPIVLLVLGVLKHRIDLCHLSLSSQLILHWVQARYLATEL